jgi:hypothetical protein
MRDTLETEMSRKKIDKEVREGFELLGLLDNYDNSDFTCAEEYAKKHFKICTRYTNSVLTTTSGIGV